MMKSLPIFFASLAFGLSFLSCKSEVKVETESTSNPLEEMAYDSALAMKLGADEYGMKPYVMAFLNSGPNQDMDSGVYIFNVATVEEAKTLTETDPDIKAG